MTVSGEISAHAKASETFGTWLALFAAGIEEHDVGGLAALFCADGSWKDYLALTWDYRSFPTPDALREAAHDAIERISPGSVAVAKGRTPPRQVRRSARDLIEGFFDFETADGHGVGFVRLIPPDRDGEAPAAWQLVTTLQSLKGMEERTGERRPSGDEFAMNTLPGNWADKRSDDKAYANRQPQVLIVGAGHAGLSLAARLTQLGVDTLLVEKEERVGDVWRRRYHSLTLHNQIAANHMPYIPFPDTWPMWLPKDKLAAWLEAYAEFLELNVWTNSTVKAARFDGGRQEWDVIVARGGVELQLHPKHLVVATGVSGSIPKRPHLAGLESFRGEVVHSSEFRTGAKYAGKRALVVGTGNSGHDIAQDLHVGGAAQVTMYQRSPTCVVSLDPVAKLTYSVYSGDVSVEDTDIQTLAIPYDVLKETYQWLTKKARSLDHDLISGLNKAGLETYYGRDETGFHMMYLRGEGGYYINVGCSDLIIDGKVSIVQAEDTERFVPEGLKMKNGEILPLDLVVLATGFENMQENIRAVLGDEIADRVGSVWGFDAHFAMQNMWRRTPQQGLWIMGGGLIDARLFSRFLALQIAAALTGVLPAPAAPTSPSVAA